MYKLPICALTPDLRGKFNQSVEATTRSLRCASAAESG
jgi:hypothetical protein